MRTRVLVLALCVSMGFIACGTTSDSLSEATTTAGGTTTTDAATTTTEADTTETTSDEPTTILGGVSNPTTPTTEGNPGEVLAPSGDERLVPLLLEPEDFRSGLTYDDSSDDAPEKEFCDGVDFTVEWQRSASMSAKSTDDSEFIGTAESIIAFDPGRAAAFLTEFEALTKECDGKNEGIGVKLVPLEGFGDGGFRNAPSSGTDDSQGLELVLVRVGDDVIVMFGLFSDKPLLTDALITKAVDKVKAG